MKKTIQRAAALCLLTSWIPAHALLVDFDGSTDGGTDPSQGPTETGALSFLENTDRDALAFSNTFTDAFGAGLDLGVAVLIDDSTNSDGGRWRDQGEITTGPGATLTDLLRDGVGARRGLDFNGTDTDTLTLTLTLPEATLYQITLYHHRDDRTDIRADIDFGNDGSYEYGSIGNNTDGLESSGNGSASVTTSMHTFSISTPGESYEIFFRNENNSNSYFPVNGFEITAIPEPSTFVLVGLSISSLLFIRRRRG